MATLEDIKNLLEKMLLKQGGRGGNSALGEGGLSSSKDKKGSDDVEKLVKSLGDIFKPLKQVADTFYKTAALLNNVAKVFGGTKAASASAAVFKARVASASQLTRTSKTTLASLQQGLNHKQRVAVAKAFKGGRLGKGSGGSTTGAGAKEWTGAGEGAAEAAEAGGPYVAVAAVIAALVALPPIVSAFGDSIQDARAPLAEFSAGMSAVFAQRQVFTTLQNMRIGDARSEGAQGLEDALEKLSRSLEPMYNLLANTMSETLASLAILLSDAVELFNDLGVGPLDGLHKTMKFIHEELVAFRRYWGFKEVKDNADDKGYNAARFWRGTYEKLHIQPMRNFAPVK